MAVIVRERAGALPVVGLEHLEPHVHARNARRHVVWRDRKSTRLNSSHTEIYTLSLHDALPIYGGNSPRARRRASCRRPRTPRAPCTCPKCTTPRGLARSEEHTSELQSHRDLHSFPTRRSSDLWR